MPRLAVNGIELNYRLEGDGPETVVLVCGLGDDLTSWGGQMPDLLAAGYRVLRFDNRGIGESSKPNGPYSTKQMAQDTKALVDALGLARFHLLGYSMGGMIAQEYALAYGRDLASLTLGSTLAWPGPYCERLFAMWQAMAEAKGTAFAMRDVVLHCFTPPFFEREPALAAEFEKAYYETAQPTEAFLAQLGAIQSHDARDRVGRIEAPTLVLVGEEDVLIPVVQSRDLFARMPGAEWKAIPGAHASVWEFPKSFNAAVLDFLGRRRQS